MKGKEQVAFKNAYAFTYIHKHEQLMKKEVMDLKKSKEGYTGIFGGRKGIARKII